MRVVIQPNNMFTNNTNHHSFVSQQNLLLDRSRNETEKLRKLQLVAPKNDRSLRKIIYHTYYKHTQSIIITFDAAYTNVCV